MHTHLHMIILSLILALLSTGLSERASVVHSSIEADDVLKEKSFDLIISNPPYVRTDDMNNLQPEIKW